MTKPYSARFRTLALALTLPFMASCAKKISKEELDTMYRDAQSVILSTNDFPPEFPENTVEDLQRECESYCLVPKYIQKDGKFLYDKKTGEPYIEKYVFPMMFEGEGVVIIELPLDKPATESQIESGEAKLDIKGENKKRNEEIIAALYTAMNNPSPKTEPQKQATLAAIKETTSTGPNFLKAPKIVKVKATVTIEQVRDAEKELREALPGLTIKPRIAGAQM